MAKKSLKKRTIEKKPKLEEKSVIHPEIKRNIWAIVFLGLGVITLLASFGQAGPWGKRIYGFFEELFGLGYYLFPLIFFLLSFSFSFLEKKSLVKTTIFGSIFFVLAGLGLIDLVLPGQGGGVGEIIGFLKKPFGLVASLVIVITVILISLLLVINRPIKVILLNKKEKELREGAAETFITGSIIDLNKQPVVKEDLEKEINKQKRDREDAAKAAETDLKATKDKRLILKAPINYTPPPLNLLSSSVERPTVGDLRANANIIKRTLEGFGIVVEMGEINVGPTVTRYTLKPAEGIKLSRITALNQDLALALAAHPIRIEAPIPGKSLVGIEMPNKAAALVRLGSLLLYEEFQKSDFLVFVLGRGVSGEPVFADIAKMPHLLIAGSTGSGKSIMIHSLLITLLYKNSPETLKIILIDPKRVELSVYDGLPHLIAPVITDNKKAISVLRWVINEMDKRYRLLLQAGARDIKSYNKSGNLMPYILVIIDELADLMNTYGREFEGSIIRLAQMSRATGIHLIVSTQRPSVEVITGLIKANITSRIALQVASQIDSRTILDTGGAEKLLGSGDLLFISAEKSKPVRIQGAYITEEEIKKVADFIKKHNQLSQTDDLDVSLVAFPVGSNSNVFFNPPAGGDDYQEEDDELYKEALKTVMVAKKASASLLQRRLKIGYARAARLLDIMEERGIIGPADGAKPREILKEIYGK